MDMSKKKKTPPETGTVFEHLIFYLLQHDYNLGYPSFFPIFFVGYRPIGCLWVVADDTLKRLVAVACLGELGVIYGARNPDASITFPGGKH
jgi:hypothetical protein